MPTIEVTYEERTVLLMAISVLRNHEAKKPLELQQLIKPAIDSVAAKISRTECQPGGCSYCTGEPDYYGDQ